MQFFALYVFQHFSAITGLPLCIQLHFSSSKFHFLTFKAAVCRVCSDSIPTLCRLPPFSAVIIIQQLSSVHFSEICVIT